MGCGAPRAAELGALRTGDIPGLANDFVGVECGEDAPLSRPHVVAAVPVVVLLQLHQDGVVHVQLQLILVARDEPVRAGGREERPPSLPRGRGVGRGRRGTWPCAAHLNTARWVCSRSSPFTMQENSPKDSVPGAGGGSITQGQKTPGTTRGPAGRAPAEPEPLSSTATAPQCGAGLRPWHGDGRGQPGTAGMLHSMGLHGAARHGTARNGTMQPSTVNHSTARQGTARHGAVQHSNAWHMEHSPAHGTARRGAVTHWRSGRCC